MALDLTELLNTPNVIQANINRNILYVYYTQPPDNVAPPISYSFYENKKTLEICVNQDTVYAIGSDIDRVAITLPEWVRKIRVVRMEP